MGDGAAATPGSAGHFRLKRRADFLAAAGGRRFHTERMSVQARSRSGGEVRDGEPAEGLHVGFTITKRVGHATERNRIRRRLRRAVELAAEGIAPLAADLVVIGRRPILSAPFAVLVDDLKRAIAAARRAREPGKERDRSARAPSPGTPAHSSHRRGAVRPHAVSRTDTPLPHGTTDG